MRVALGSLAVSRTMKMTMKRKAKAARGKMGRPGLCSGKKNEPVFWEAMSYHEVLGPAHLLGHLL